MTNTSDHDRLCELLAKATKGPWHISEQGSSIRCERMLYRADGSEVGMVDSRMMFGHDGNSEQRAADFALIVAAVNALPDLLTLIESQAQQIVKMEAENGDLRKIMDAMSARHEAQLAAVELLTTPTILTRELLEGLREPTDEMIRAGFRIDTSDTPSFEEALAIAFTAMIDEAIRALSNAPGEKG